MICIDARGLEPPEPFERTMEALCNLAPGEEILLVIDREPRPLYRVLDRNGYAWQATHHEDGRFEVLIRQRADARIAKKRR